MDINRLFESLFLKYLSFLQKLSLELHKMAKKEFLIFEISGLEIDKTINCETDMSFEQTLNGALSDFEMNENIIRMGKS